MVKPMIRLYIFHWKINSTSIRFWLVVLAFEHSGKLPLHPVLSLDQFGDGVQHFRGAGWQYPIASSAAGHAQLLRDPRDATTMADRAMRVSPPVEALPGHLSRPLAGDTLTHQASGQNQHDVPDVCTVRRITEKAHHGKAERVTLSGKAERGGHVVRPLLPGEVSAGGGADGALDSIVITHCVFLSSVCSAQAGRLH